MFHILVLCCASFSIVHVVMLPMAPLSEQEIQVGFEQFKKNKEAHLRYILARSEKDAQDIYRLAQRMDFSRLARERSVAPSVQVDSGDLGIIREPDLWASDNDKRVIFHSTNDATAILPPLEITWGWAIFKSEIIGMDTGWHVFKIEGLRPLTVGTFESVRPKIVATLEVERNNRRYDPLKRLIGMK